MKKPPNPTATGAGLSRPPLERMMQIHSHLQEKHFPNCSKIARQLEVSPKTIQRDIDFMASCRISLRFFSPPENPSFTAREVKVRSISSKSIFS